MCNMQYLYAKDKFFLFLHWILPCEEQTRNNWEDVSNHWEQGPHSWLLQHHPVS